MLKHISLWAPLLLNVACQPEHPVATAESSGTTDVRLQAEEYGLLGDAEKALKTASDECGRPTSGEAGAGPERPPSVPFLKPYAADPKLFEKINPDFEPVVGADREVIDELCRWVDFYQTYYLKRFEMNKVSSLDKRSARVRVYANILALGWSVRYASGAPDLFRGVRSKRRGKLLVAQIVSPGGRDKIYSDESIHYAELSVNPFMLPELGETCASLGEAPERREVRNAPLAAVAMVVHEASEGGYEYVYAFSLSTSAPFLGRLGFENYPGSKAVHKGLAEVQWLPGGAYATFLRKHLGV